MTKSTLKENKNSSKMGDIYYGRCKDSIYILSCLSNQEYAMVCIYGTYIGLHGQGIHKSVEEATQGYTKVDPGTTVTLTAE